MTINHNDSLLGYVARRHTQGMEDVMTSARAFVLNRSESARNALSAFLRDADGAPLPIHSVDTQYYLSASHSYPDMAPPDATRNRSRSIAPLLPGHGPPCRRWQCLSIH